jgi:membrane-associated protease RseP (regulator of RpoE activity)
MEKNYDLETIDALVKRIFRIDDITLGTDHDHFLVRYRGRILLDNSEEAYDQLAAQLKPRGLTPLFRWDGDQHAILIIPGLPTPKRSNPFINLGLAILTLLSVLLTGGLYGMDTPLPTDPIQLVLAIINHGWPFALSMLGILAAHEFGHYLAGRYHGVHVSLPYFIPMPFSPFGTMGAFINMKEPPKNRKVLLDIGAAGPLAGLVVAVPVLLLGLMLSKVQALPAAPAANISLQLEGNSILYLLAKYLVYGQLLPAPISYGNLSPVLYWLRFFFTGRPFPFGGADVMLNGVAWAGWAGLLVTALNLIPAGTLDGGHILYVLFGRKRAARLLPFILGTLALLGLVWSGWWLWAAIIFFLGRVYAEPLDQITPLNKGRILLAVLALVLFLLTFTPVPLSFM